MNAILIGGIFLFGCGVGFVTNALLSANKHVEDCINAFENGKKFERMQITKSVDDISNN